MLQLVLHDASLVPGAPLEGELRFGETRTIGGVTLQMVQRETTLEDSPVRRMRRDTIVAERAVCGPGTAHAGTSVAVSATMPPDIGPSGWTPHGRIEFWLRAVAETPEGECSVETAVVVLGGSPTVGNVQARQQDTNQAITVVVLTLLTGAGIFAAARGLWALIDPPAGGRGAGLITIVLGFALLGMPLVGARRLLHRRRAPVTLSLDSLVLARGQVAEVIVTHHQEASELVARYSITEHYMERGGPAASAQRRGNLLSHDLHHESVPLRTGNDVVRFTVPSSAPPTLAGDLVRVTHTIEVLPARSASRRGRLLSRRAHVDLVVLP